MTSVVQEWINNLSWKQQTVLLAAFRGCDGLPKSDPSKRFTKQIREVILKNADPTSTFIESGLEYDLSYVKDFFIDCSRGGIDAYPVHWMMHFLQAAEVIGYKHPDSKIRKYWLEFYLSGIRALHVNPESEKQLDQRLQDNMCQ